MADTRRNGPLAGVKVIELAHIMAGPVCGLMLGDMGAEVIKVEKIPGGDDTRRSVPPAIAGESAAYMMMNRGKSGIALDLKSADGKAVLHRLLADADVLIENYPRRHDGEARPRLRSLARALSRTGLLLALGLWPLRPLR